MRRSTLEIRQKLLGSNCLGGLLSVRGIIRELTVAPPPPPSPFCLPCMVVLKVSQPGFVQRLIQEFLCCVEKSSVEIIASRARLTHWAGKTTIHNWKVAS